MFKLNLMKYSFFLIFIFCAHFFSLDGVSPEEELRTLLNQWPKEFNAKNRTPVCDLFASDLIATYPGVPDKSYADMCQHIAKVFSHAETVFRYDTPDIEQMIVEGDIAVVRLTWTLSISNNQSPAIEVIKERGLDVFKRQPDGSWKIIISYAYPIQLTEEV